MDIVMPWPPLVILLVYSFFALYAGLLLCHVEKPVAYKVALVAFIPWVLAVAVVWLGERSSYYGSGPFWLWLSILVMLGYGLVQLLLIWKFLKLKFIRALLALLVWGATIILLMALVVLIVRITDAPHVSVDIK